MSKVKELRLKQVYECVAAAGGAGATANEIAACVGLASGGWLKALLHEIEGYGWLRHEDAVVETARGLRTASKYFVIPEGVK